MNHRDRFFATIHQQPVDHLASWLGLPVPSAKKKALIKYFEISSIDQLRILIGNDFGSQTALMVEPGDLREFVFPGTRKLIDQANDMDAPKLKSHFEGKVSFCGGVDAQDLLVHGTLEEVTRKVHELKELFSSGLVISPSHEAILPDIPPANIEAMFSALKQQG